GRSPRSSFVSIRRRVASRCAPSCARSSRRRGRRRRRNDSGGRVVSITRETRCGREAHEARSSSSRMKKKAPQPARQAEALSAPPSSSLLIVRDRRSHRRFQARTLESHPTSERAGLFGNGLEIGVDPTALLALLALLAIGLPGLRPRLLRLSLADAGLLLGHSSRLHAAPLVGAHRLERPRVAIDAFA